MTKKFTFFQFLTATVLVVAVLFPVKSFAQENYENLQFQRVSEAVEGHQYLSNLLTYLNPTLYINEGSTVPPITTPPLVIECAPSQIAQLYEENSDFENVYLLKIRISSPQDLFTLDIAQLRSFSQLQYVYLLFEYDACGNGTDGCICNLMQNRILPGNSFTTVIYAVSIPN